jgi:hypothetical protein
MAQITRYRDRNSRGIYDVFDDGRRYAYYRGDRFSQWVIKIYPDDTSVIIHSDSPDWDEIEEPGKNSVLSLAGYYDMDQSIRSTWRLVMWYEIFCWPQLYTTKLAIESSIPIPATQFECMKAVLLSWHVNPANVFSVATNLITLDQKPKFTELGMSDAPERFIILEAGEH